MDELLKELGVAGSKDKGLEVKERKVAQRKKELGVKELVRSGKKGTMGVERYEDKSSPKSSPKKKKAKKKKAKPLRPPSKGGAGVRCYMRYGNAGQMYRICKGPPPPTTKPPAVFTPLITPSTFIAQLSASSKGKISSYGDLSSSQRSNYHRLAQAQTREDRRENAEMNNEQYTLFLEQKRTDAKIDRLEDKLEKKKEKEEKKIQKNMEGKGILASNEEEIGKYYDKRLEKELKIARSSDSKEDFIKRKKEQIEKRFKEQTSRPLEDQASLMRGDLRSFLPDNIKDKLKKQKEGKLSENDKKALERTLGVFFRNYQAKLRLKQNKEVEQQFERNLKSREKQIKEGMKDKEARDRAKLEVAQRDSKTSGKTAEWVRKNVQLIFDKDYSGVGDLSKFAELTSKVAGSFERVQELKADLEKAQAEQKKTRGATKEKMDELEKQSLASKEARIKALTSKKLSKKELEKAKKKYAREQEQIRKAKVKIEKAEAKRLDAEEKEHNKLKKLLANIRK